MAQLPPAKCPNPGVSTSAQKLYQQCAQYAWDVATADCANYPSGPGSNKVWDCIVPNFGVRFNQQKCGKFCTVTRRTSPMYHGVGEIPYGPQAAYKDGVLGEYFTPLGQEVDANEAATDEDDKKKMLMYGGIAAGVLVLGIVVYAASKKRR
jgi:hypothetical protein